MGLGIGRALRSATNNILGGTANLFNPAQAFTGLLGPQVLGALGGSGKTDVGKINPTIAGFSSPGLSGKFNRDTNQFDISRSSNLTGLLSRTQSLSQGLGDDIKGLRSLVAPGVSQLRASQLDALEGRRRKAIGNLRENLGRRRVLGSSFGADALARTEAEFAREQADIEAQTSLVELQQTRELIQQEAQARLQGVQVALSQANLESSLGAQLSQGATTAINDIVKFQTELAFRASEGEMNRDAQALQGLGQLGGTVATLAMLGSDMRIKESIKYIGNWLSQKWYEFKYIGGKYTHLGVMAQEVDRGVKEINGTLFVDYEELLWQG